VEEDALDVVVLRRVQCAGHVDEGCALGQKRISGFTHIVGQIGSVVKQVIGNSMSILKSNGSRRGHIESRLIGEARRIADDPRIHAMWNMTGEFSPSTVLTDLQFVEVLVDIAS
jgi:hypothetical protein